MEQKDLITNEVSTPVDPSGEYLNYCFPTLDLLQDIGPNLESVDEQEQDDNKAKIRDILGRYGIKVKEILVHIGPAVSLYEIVPQDGARWGMIRGAEDDIEMSIATLGVRIIAPMPEQGTSALRYRTSYLKLFQSVRCWTQKLFKKVMLNYLFA